jgi:hypothetical protein
MASFFSIRVALFLITTTCFAQQANQLVYIEGTVQRADGTPVTGASVSFSTGTTFLTSGLGHYFAVVPSDFTGSAAASGNGYSYGTRFYSATVSDQLKQDFTGGTYTASGIVQARFGGVPGVGLYFSGLGQGAVSGADGSYSLTIPQGYSGSTTPLSTTVTFTPSSTDVFGGAFTATGYTSGALAYGIPAPWFLSAGSGINCARDDFQSTYLFPPTTPQIYVYMATYPVDTFSFLWYDPSGTIRHQTPNSQLGGCGVATSLAVAGTDVAQHPGLWHVDFQSSRISGSIPFAVLSPQPPTVPSSFGSMAHLASGDGWDSTIELVNTGAASAHASASFFGDDGTPLALPLVSGSSTVTIGNTLTPDSTLVIDSNSPGPLLTGYTQLTTDAGVGGFIRFRYASQDQEAIVPLETRNASSYALAFDNTGAIATGVAVANLTAAPANISVLVRDNSGAQIGSSSLSLPANGHAAFVLTDRFTSTVNQTGTIEFDTPSGGQISVLGLRFPPSGRFTTIPVLASTDTGGGSMAHLAVGDGWTTTIELVNYGTYFAQANLSFFDDNGNPLALPWIVSGNSAQASVLNQTLAPHTRLVVQSNALNTDPLQSGSAQLVTNGSVSGFMRFLYGPRNQEAIVPIEARNGSSYILPFDNTNGLVAGVAVSNGSGAPANIPVVIRDSTGTRIGLGIVTLAGNGHSAFVLSDEFPITANQTGTIEFGAPAQAKIGVLGFRFPQSGAFSTIPVLAP